MPSSEFEKFLEKLKGLASSWENRYVPIEGDDTALAMVISDATEKGLEIAAAELREALNSAQA